MINFFLIIFLLSYIIKIIILDIFFNKTIFRFNNFLVIYTMDNISG
jgi:hypothetical protein